MQTFETIAIQVHNDRVRERHYDHLKKEECGEYIYHSFSLWCGCFEPNKDRNSAKVFAEYLKERNITLTFFQRKYLSEKYFGFKFEWDEEQNKWIIKRR